MVDIFFSCGSCISFLGTIIFAQKVGGVGRPRYMYRLEPTLTELDQRINIYIEEAGARVVHVNCHHDVVANGVEFVYLKGLVCIVTLDKVAYLELGRHLCFVQVE